MRVTGAADPTRPQSETLEGKLPQKKLVRGAADGYSSYGNQIGLATGYVKEVYHPDYVAKRMEIGAVLEQHRAVPLSVKIPIRAISSSCSAAVLEETAAAAQLVPPKYIRQNPSRPAVQRYRKETHRLSVNCRDCSAARKSAF